MSLRSTRKWSDREEYRSLENKQRRRGSTSLMLDKAGWRSHYKARLVRFVALRWQLFGGLEIEAVRWRRWRGERGLLWGFGISFWGLDVEINVLVKVRRNAGLKVWRWKLWRLFIYIYMTSDNLRSLSLGWAPSTKIRISSFGSIYSSCDREKFWGPEWDPYARRHVSAPLPSFAFWPTSAPVPGVNPGFLCHVIEIRTCGPEICQLIIRYCIFTL